MKPSECWIGTLFYAEYNRLNGWSYCNKTTNLQNKLQTDTSTVTSREVQQENIKNQRTSEQADPNDLKFKERMPLLLPLTRGAQIKWMYMYTVQTIEAHEPTKNKWAKAKHKARCKPKVKKIKSRITLFWHFKFNGEILSINAKKVKVGINIANYNLFPTFHCIDR